MVCRLLRMFTKHGGCCVIQARLEKNVSFLVSVQHCQHDSRKPATRRYIMFSAKQPFIFKVETK